MQINPLSLNSLIEIRQTSHKELSRVANFLDLAPMVHRHLDWHPTLDWIDDSPFLILSKADEILSIFAAPPDPPGIAWIRCFAVGKKLSPDSVLNPILDYVQPVLDSLNAKLIAVGLEDWFTRVLIKNGFSTRQKIVVLEWDHHHPSVYNPMQEVHIRPMEEADISAISEVDRLSFEPIWVNSPSSLYLAYLQSAHTLVAEVDGKIVGYELSTASQFAAHLARLAVFPEYRNHSIGHILVSEMLDFYSRRGVIQITVNTQNDNLASLHLYKSLGFKLTSEEYPVLNK